MFNSPVQAIPTQTSELRAATTISGSVRSCVRKRRSRESGCRVPRQDPRPSDRRVRPGRSPPNKTRHRATTPVVRCGVVRPKPHGSRPPNRIPPACCRGRGSAYEGPPGGRGLFSSRASLRPGVAGDGLAIAAGQKPTAHCDHQFRGHQGTAPPRRDSLTPGPALR